ncbi:MAG TPA: SDR family NAD(P)-dependent oxidoreductase, partial [Sphingobacterium sp.]|nr:SDR family NAD(P)-dependent oxidoreductase [Sphingobacterium sp.]
MRTVLITGASSGIGSACAEVLARENKYRLILCARRTDKLGQLKNKINIENPTCAIHTFQLDVRDQEAVLATLSSLPAEWQKIDILINNAGLSQGLDSIQDGNPDDWDR